MHSMFLIFNNDCKKSINKQNIETNDILREEKNCRIWFKNEKKKNWKRVERDNIIQSIKL